MQNVQNFFDSREKIIDFFRDYSFLLSEAKYETNYGSGLKILTTKQTLQRLPMALAQVKAGNASKNFTKWNRTNYIFFVSRRRSY